MSKTQTSRSARPAANMVGASDPSQDSRVRHDSDLEARGTRAQLADPVRTSDDGTHLTAEQRRSLIRNEFLQEALPRVPEIPGYHLCWLSTTNSYDPIHKRMRLGYTPVMAEEMTGFESLKAQSGEFPGCVACNEMLLFKIPTETYLAIMNEFHHEMPREEEEALRAQLVDETSVDSRGRKLGQITEDSDGFEQLGKKVPHGIFAH